MELRRPLSLAASVIKEVVECKVVIDAKERGVRYIENPSQVQGESGVIFRPDRGKQIQLHSHTRTVLGGGE